MSFGSFFKFDRLITPSIIRLVFWLGLGVIVMQWLSTLTGMANIALSGNWRGLLGMAVTLLLFLLSAVIWRVICELLLVVFEIRDRLASLDAKTKQSL